MENVRVLALVFTEWLKYSRLFIKKERLLPSTHFILAIFLDPSVCFTFCDPRDLLLIFGIVIPLRAKNHTFLYLHLVSLLHLFICSFTCLKKKSSFYLLFILYLCHLLYEITDLVHVCQAVYFFVWIKSMLP